jgi:ribonuclease BN (tRNA processing enzyme)
MRLTVIGCGNAFGAGGRLQTCFHLETQSGRYLLDCGATSLVGLARLELDANDVDAILITHLHGDHFGGLVWWLMHAHYVSGRTRPLVVTGPAGLRERLQQAAEALFPGSSALPLRFDLAFREYAAGAPLAVGGLGITPFEVEHPSGAPAYALRLDNGGHRLSFSGDTGWVDALLPCADGADLFIVDCHGYDSDAGFHMSWKTISGKLPSLGARRIMLSHMGPSMLEKRGTIHDPRIILAEDGLVVEVGGTGAAAPKRRTAAG